MSNPKQNALTIGQVAERSGLNTSAIRYYERVGLLAPPARASKRRVYTESVLEALALIRLAQDAGFTVAETRMLMHGFDGATPASERWRKLTREKLVEVAARIERAERMRALLERLARCRCQTLDECVRSRKAAVAAAGILTA